MTENPTNFRPPAADDIVLCAPRRTPVGRYGGVFRDLAAQDLAVAAVRAVVEATGIAPEDVDDVILGQAPPTAPRRHWAGWSPSTPGWANRCPACSWTAAAAPGYRPWPPPPRTSPPEPPG